MSRTVGAISGEAIRRERRRQRLSAEDTAERYADASMTHTVLMNIEAGRRKAPATIDEWLRLAYVLGVPPESLLMPDDNSDAMFEIAPGVIIDRVQFARWLRGQAPIGDVEPRHYAQVAALTLPEDGQRSSTEASQEIARRVASMLDMVDTETAETVRNARRQIHDLLSELDNLVTSGEDRDQISDTIRSYKERLVALS